MAMVDNNNNVNGDSAMGNKVDDDGNGATGNDSNNDGDGDQDDNYNGNSDGNIAMGDDATGYDDHDYGNR